MGWPGFYERSRRAGGVVPLTATAGAAGLSPHAVRRRARQEAWWWPFPDVVAIPGTVIDARARAHAAVLHAHGTTGDADRDVAAATRWTAAYLLGVNRHAPTRPQITIPSSRAVVARSGPRSARSRTDGPAYEVVRSNSLVRADVTLTQHVPTVGAVRLVRDLSAICDRERLRAIVIDLVQRGETSLAALRAHLGTWRSFTGRPVVRQVLADLEAAGRTDSPLELEVRRRFGDAGIPLDRGQVPVRLRDGRTIHCDLGIHAIRFGVEVDSMGFHSSRADLLADALRSNALTASADRWRIVRVTWDLLGRERWGDLVVAVRHVVTEQSQLFLGVDWPRPEHVRS